MAYGYDSEGRRIRKVTGGQTTQWVYDGQNIYAEYGAAWTNPNAIYSAAGIDRPLIRATVSGSGYGQAQYYHADGLGSVVATSNNSDNTTATQRFDAWGSKLAATGTIAQYSYTGREPDETGLIYYRARYYDPSSGRFARRDPVGLAGGINSYAYASNNPANLNDPLGDRPLTPGEIQLLTPIFNNTINYPIIDVQSGANGNLFAAIALGTGHPGITLGNTIYLDSNTYRTDFASPSVGVGTQSIFVHEVTHVWQGQTNPNYSEFAAMIEGAQGLAAYQYNLSPSNPATVAGPPKPLTLYGFEQQAAMVQDYYLNSHGQPMIYNLDRSLPPQILDDAYTQQLGTAGLGPAVGNGTGNAPPGNQTLTGQTPPPPPK